MVGVVFFCLFSPASLERKSENFTKLLKKSPIFFIYIHLTFDFLLRYVHFFCKKKFNPTIEQEKV